MKRTPGAAWINVWPRVETNNNKAAMKQLDSHMHMEVDVSFLYFPVLVLHIIE
jgi:hypothetical protein